MNIEGLVVKLRIEEDNRNAERRRAISMAKANFVEHGPKNKNKNWVRKEEFPRSKLNFKENVLIVIRCVTRLWIAGCLKRSERRIWWKASLNMFQT